MTFLLKCCGRSDPLGVDPENVRLHFETDGSQAITACTVQIKEYSSQKAVCSLPCEGHTAWVPARFLRPCAGYSWQVCAELADGSTVTSEPGFFETGLQQWQGQWIGLPAPDGQVLEFQKEISLSTQPIKARLYICGVGFFAAQLNGCALDQAYFVPPVTNYTYRPQFPDLDTGYRVTYYTYDVTALLRTGSNVLNAQVSDGYFSHWEKVYYEPLPDMSFGQPGLIYELHIEDAEGLHCFVSDGTTLARMTNAVSRLYSGDYIDYTKEPSAYTPAVPIAPLTGSMTTPMCPEDRLAQVLTPVASWKTPEGTVYDFGINHSGGLRFTAIAQKETTLQIRFAEVLNADGSLNFETGTWHASHIHTGMPRSIYQQNTYRLKEGENVIEPKFGWYCYRYALIPDTVQIRDFTSLFIHMDMECDGSFESTEPLLNRLHEVFVQTLKCNMHSGGISDCPHRERLPYTGDGKLVMKSACYSMSAVDFFYKWFRDILDSQSTDGRIPNTAPHLGGGGGYAWGNAVCTVTKQLYELTGDKTVAREGYEAILRWLDYYQSNCGADGVIRSNSHSWLLGDWLAPEVVTSDVYYISTVCHLQAVKTALFLAKELDCPDAEKWQMLIKSITDSINRVFFNPDKCTYGHGVQGENMLALAEGIVPPEYRQRMKQQLIRHYSVETDYHLDTGIVLTPVLIDYLTENGLQEIAWRIMTAKTFPSYFSLMEGESTFSEHWSKKWPDYYIGEIGNSRLIKGGGDLSHCHPMYGSVVAWLYEKVAGLDLSRLYQQKVLITPHFMEYLSGAEASKHTPWGQVSVAWTCEKGVYTLNISVPEGLTAQCCFPTACKRLKDPVTEQCLYPDAEGFFRFELGAGKWQLTGTDTSDQ